MFESPSSSSGSDVLARMPTAVDGRAAYGLLLVITAVATVVRVWGVDFGLPFLYHPDEPNKIAMAQTMVKTGDLNPHYFLKPTLFIYMNALAYIPYYLVGKAAGALNSVTDIPYPTMLAMGTGVSAMPTTVLMGRLLTVSFSVLSIPLMFFLGRTTYDSAAIGLMAALWLALSPTHVANSRFITVNAFLVFALLLTALFSQQIYRRHRTVDYVAAGLATGITVSFKYPGALVVVMILTAHFAWTRWHGLRDWRLYLALTLVPVAFVLTSPYALIDFSTFMRDTLFESRHYATGHAGMEGDALRWYLEYLWRAESIIVLLAVLEIGRAIYRRSMPSLILAAFTIVYFIFISSFQVRNDRTALPLIPFLILLGCAFLMQLAGWTRKLQSAAGRWVLTVTTVLLVLWGLWSPMSRMIEDAQRLNRIDGRETARIWLIDNLAEGTKIGLESYAPFVDPHLHTVEGFGRMIDHPPEWYEENGFDHLVFSSGMYGRFYRDQSYASEREAYDQLFDRFELLQKFTDGGFEVRVYQVK